MAHIRNRRDFLAAASGGKKFVTGTFIMQMHKRASDHPETFPGARLGYTVTKKMGNAVIRNRIKRRLREAARAKSALAKDGHDYVIISRLKALECPFSELVRDMEFAFSRIPTMKDGTASQQRKKP